MKRAGGATEITRKKLKIGKNLIKVRMVADCCQKVAARNVKLDHEKETSAATDTLGNTWNVGKIRIITIENESEEDETVPEALDFMKVTLPPVDKPSKQPCNLIDELASHSIMDSHCHIDFILDRRQVVLLLYYLKCVPILRLSKLNLCTWTRLVQRYPALHHPALKGFIQNFCDPPK